MQLIKIEQPAPLPGEVTLTLRDGGAVTIPVTWRHYGDRELRALLRVQASDAQLLAELLHGWSGVGDEADQAVPPNERAIARLLDQLDGTDRAGSGGASARAFFEAFKRARSDAARGN